VDWCVIPDVSDGDEAANDALLAEWGLPGEISVPVYHLHESLERLARLVDTYPRVALDQAAPTPLPAQAPGGALDELEQTPTLVVFEDMLAGLRMLPDRPVLASGQLAGRCARLAGARLPLRAGDRARLVRRGARAA
jgi:hypothetical protein